MQVVNFFSHFYSSQRARVNWIKMVQMLRQARIEFVDKSVKSYCHNGDKRTLLTIDVPPNFHDVGN